jgi:hypothetical protein
MSARPSFFLRTLGFLLLVGALIAGGALLYQSGQARGYALGIASQAAPAAGGAPLAPAYWPYYPPYFGLFPFGGPLFFIGALFLGFFLLRLIFWPTFWGRRHHWGGPGHWNHPEGWGRYPWEKTPTEDKSPSPNQPPVSE